MAHLSAYFPLEEAVGSKDAHRLKQGLDTLPGVTSVSVSDSGACVAVDYDTTGVRHAQIRQKVQELGFPLRTDG